MEKIKCQNCDEVYDPSLPHFCSESARTAKKEKDKYSRKYSWLREGNNTPEKTSVKKREDAQQKDMEKYEEINQKDIEKEEDITTNKPNDFIKNEILKNERRLFAGGIIAIVVGYIIITLWLNAIRATAPIWFVWVLIAIQFALYFSIFISSYQRSKVLGANKTLGFIIFAVLAVLGRVNDWELFIIPLLLVIMLILSARNKKVSEEGESLLSAK